MPGSVVQAARKKMVHAMADGLGATWSPELIRTQLVPNQMTQSTHPRLEIGTRSPAILTMLVMI